MCLFYEKSCRVDIVPTASSPARSLPHLPPFRSFDTMAADVIAGLEGGCQDPYYPRRDDQGLKEYPRASRSR